MKKNSVLFFLKPRKKVKPRKKEGIDKFNLKRDYQLYLLIFIPMVYFIIFKYFPMYGVTIAFKDYNMFAGIFESPWVGFEHFKNILGLTAFKRALRNTMMLNMLDLLFMFPAPIMLAICLNEIRAERFKKVSQTILYMPHFLSWAVIGNMVCQIFATHNGIVNIIIREIGFEPIPFLISRPHWVFLYIIAGIWQSAGWDAIIYIAAMAGIDQSLYESADIDGASRVRKIFHITLPSIRSTIVIMLIMRIGSIMGIGFERPYVLSNPLVTEVSDVISTYVYRMGLQGGDFSQTTAVGLFQSLVGLVLILTANFVSKRFGEEGVW